MFTMRPPLPAWTIASAAYLLQRNTLLSEIAMTRSHSASSVSRMFLRSTTPTLLTRMSTLPSRSRTSLIIPWTCSLDVTSQVKATAAPERSPEIEAATASARSATTSTMATEAPSAAYARAMASPMLRPAPVTMATRS
jgi:hypothetical protein